MRSFLRGRKPSSGALRRSRKRSRRHLQIERLEDRNLLATLELGLQLWTNVDNAKGEKIPEVSSGKYEVEVGQTFWLQVLADDNRDTDKDKPTSAGIIALPLDVRWDENKEVNIRYTGDIPLTFPDEIPLANSIVTPQFGRQRYVTRFNADEGAVELRGASLPVLDQTQPIGKDGCDWGTKDDCRQFSLMLFTAVKEGVTEIVQANLNGSMSFADAARLDNLPFAAIEIEVIRPLTNSLSGYAYIDADRDGIRESNELPLPNVEITLTRDGNAENVITYTGPDGSYRFDNLVSGTYSIHETQPNGFVDGPDYLGQIVSSDAGPVPSTGSALQDELVDIVLERDDHGIDFNFTELGISAVDKRNFLASTPSGEMQVCKLLKVNAAYIKATAGNDTIEVFNTGNTITVQVNGTVAGMYGVSEHPVVMIDALGGDDTVAIQGTTADEIARIEPGTVSLWPDDVPLVSGYGVRVVGTETIQLDPAGGSDLVVLRDSLGDDALELNAETAAIQWDGDQQRAAVDPLETDDHLTAISSGLGGDSVSKNAPVYATELLGSWQPLATAPAAQLTTAKGSASISTLHIPTTANRSVSSAPASAMLLKAAAIGNRTAPRNLSRGKSS